MEQVPREIAWEAPQHHHVEKGNDWFFALAIIIVALIVVALIFSDPLFALVIGLAGGVLAAAAAKHPDIVPYAVSVRGVKVEGELYPYSVLNSYHIDEEDPRGAQLLISTDRKLAPILVLPLPPEHVDNIDDLLKERLPEEELHEPFALKVLELFGF
jgi:hypothetical protein